MSIDIVTIERDFTAWVAEKLNLEIDKTIFRGGIPEKIKEGVAVMFGSQIPAAGFYGFRPQTWNVQILAKFDKRDNAMMFQTRVNALFPQTGGMIYKNTNFRTIELQSMSEPFQGTDHGKGKWFVSVNVVLSVLTSSAQTA